MSQQQRGNASSRLPAIQHPLAKMAAAAAAAGDPLDVRGSADVAGGSRPGTSASVAAAAAPGKRPLPSEEAPAAAMAASRGGGSVASSRRSSVQGGRPHPAAAAAAADRPAAKPNGLRHQPIPEADEADTKLPALGVRTKAAEAALDRVRNGLDAVENGDRRSLKSSNSSSRLSEVQAARLELDEIESLIKDRVRGNYYEMRKRFIDNDPEQKGTVTRDALLRIIVTAIGRPVSLRQLAQLFERIGLRQDKQMVAFADFYTALRDQEALEFPNWMDPVQRLRQDRPALSAEQVHSHLTEKMRQRFVDMADVFPQFVDGGTGRMLKHELRSSLSKMQLPMDDDEFERLWKIYDPRDTGTVNGVAMLKKLGIVLMTKGPESGGGPVRYERRPPPPQQPRAPLKAEEERQRSLTIEAWLKDKFRDGFHQLKAALEARDPERTGLVSHDDFLAVLRERQLGLEKAHLAEFLARCAVTHSKSGVMYRDFLHRFQDRSEAGMTHKIMGNPYHTKEQDDVTRNLSSVEKQLMNMFQRDFLSLLAAFQKIDRHGLSVISQEEFRAVMESRFGFELTDAQYREFVDKLPLDSEGRVRYDVFMRQFDTKGMAPSLFRSTGGADQSETGKGDQAIDDEDEDEAPYDPNKRSVAETRRCIRDVLHHRFQEVEVAFYELDLLNGGRLTQEMMHQLLNRFIKPEVTRGEVRDLWKTFYLREREALDYQEFLRAFIHNPRTAAFPNSKLFPPKKGDSDLMMRSRKVNSDVNLLEDGLRAKIDFMWDQLRDEFVDMDPFGTGCVSREEFQEVLKELSIQLTDYELDKLTDKFTQKSDARVNYVDLLRPFAYKKQHGPRRHHISELLSHRGTGGGDNGNSSSSSGLHQVSAKLRSGLSGELKSLRRQLMKLDSSNSGLVDLAGLRSVLKQFHIALNDEDVFQLMSYFDTSLSGKVPYRKLLELLRSGPGKQVVSKKAGRDPATSRKQ